MLIYEQLGSELGVIRALNQDCDWNKTLHFCEFEFIYNESNEIPTIHEVFIHEVFTKILKRGTKPFCSFSLEEKIIELYGGEYTVSINKPTRNGSISYQYNPELTNRYNLFRDLVQPWSGDIENISFDPSSPHHERDFFSNLIKWFPDNLGNMIKTQVMISDLLPEETAKKFIGQRVDFLVTFPNGKSIVLEPGDHKSYSASLQLLDQQRDAEFRKQDIPTKRLENKEISDQKTRKDIYRLIKNCEGEEYLVKGNWQRKALDLCENYLFLLPSLITRIEFLLADFYLSKGLIHKETLNIGVIERDLSCAVLAIEDFETWITRIAGLYGVEIRLPKVQLYIQNNPVYDFGKKFLKENVTYEAQSFESYQLDILLDVAIKCNSSTTPVKTGAPFIGSVRQTAPNYSSNWFGYRSSPQAIDNRIVTDELLKTFLQDIFRKWEFRDGQIPILKSILLQKNTIGLLPTSGGKSICYQLASILTPGTTIVVDPINSLMENQVNSLRKYYGIDRVFAWNNQSAAAQSVQSLLYGYIMVFISPERLQRDSFRSAMQNLKAADIFVNFVVIDEAHCISMWGHDFRPSYLMLESNIRKYCQFNAKQPPVVALTGTASQLVLIDMKRELKIDELDSIVRPKSFDRPELNFNLVRVNSNNKYQMLETVEKSIARRLNVRNLSDEANGIVFAYTPNELWELLGQHQPASLGHISEILDNDGKKLVKFGVYCGTSPKDFPGDNWQDYKDKVLNLFQDGKIGMLFGNNAIAVGIDNPKINYVINYRMPQSLEAYYQESGRAGREGQSSECYLIFTDDDPQKTKSWLDRKIDKMGKRYDDLGIVSFFHHDNFPGIDTDVDGTKKVFRNLLESKNSICTITANLGGSLDQKQSKKTEKYLSYLTILGIIKDYEVEGSISNSRFKIILADEVANYLLNNDQAELETYLFGKLADYQNRYRPTTSDEIRKQVMSIQGNSLSSMCITYLIGFIYKEIEYQRREAIKTLVEFCNEENTTPEILRSRLIAYLDYSEKFSGKLLALAEGRPNIEKVVEIIRQVESFQDGETLYYETRRLLDERMRSDWLAVNIYAFVFREHGNYSVRYLEELENLMDQLEIDDSLTQIEKRNFIAIFLSQFMELDKVFTANIGVEFISKSLIELSNKGNKYGVTIYDLITQLTVSQLENDAIKLTIINHQLEEILNGRYSQIFG
jgi:superfamily II DNA or RNA helicase